MIIYFRKIPSLFELISYVFAFHFVMLGPTAFYKDYDDFITGKNLGPENPSYAVGFTLV